MRITADAAAGQTLVNLYLRANGSDCASTASRRVGDKSRLALARPPREVAAATGAAPQQAPYDPRAVHVRARESR